jgi:hypothetical protein
MWNKVLRVGATEEILVITTARWMKTEVVGKIKEGRGITSRERRGSIRLEQEKIDEWVDVEF